MKHLLRTLILLLVRLLGMWNARNTAHETATRPPRILLVRPDHLGDLVLTTPILDALRNALPDATITMIVGAWSSEIVARHPALDRLITCPFPGFRREAQGPLEPYVQLFRTAQQVRRGKYDLAINLRPDFWWGAALLYLAAIPYRVGYALEPGTQFFTHAEPFHAAEHATVSSLRLVSAALHALNRPMLKKPYTPEQYPLVFLPSEEEQIWVTEHLQSAAIDTNVRVVVLHAGTGAAVKLWRTEAWASVVNTLTGRFVVHIVLTGSLSERPMLMEIAQDITADTLLVTDATVGQLAALLKRATLVLGVDNGPLHLAVAQGTPTLQIFGPTDTHIFGPWGPVQAHPVIASTHRCASCATIPCGRLDFKADELSAHPCVRLVSAQVVQTASIALLEKYSSTTKNIVEDFKT